MINDLKVQVRNLEADLRGRALEDPKLNQEWRDARSAERTAATYESWLEDRVTQVAVAWVLGTVFVRFCEDNGLIEFPAIAGPGERTAQARELQAAFFERHPEKTDRDWIIEGFTAMSVSPVAAGLFEQHNPMWTILPSHDAAKALLDFWRRTGPDGKIVHDLTDPEWNTRFLGDLYQDLSEHAKKTYALRQTPEFVEGFILKYTLSPAIEEFGLEPSPPYGHEDLPHRLRVIDPTCGSGHFLLGAFRRILTEWQSRSPGTDEWDLISRTLESVHGVDKNPFAVAIARFRLMLAAMREGGVTRLTAKIDFPLNIAIGDSLIHGEGAMGIQGEFDFGGEKHTHTYRTEDIDDYIESVRMLSTGTYHVVVGNPPYITVKDKQENENYRKAYKSCAGIYHLSVPFTERIFQLAIRGSQGGGGAGYAGLIIDNAFMKREFGKRLIQEYLPNIELTYIIDTSGAYIPGHGTPTVILIGRRRYARAGSTVRAVLRLRREPARHNDPAGGPVWRAIVAQIDKPGSETEWISVADFPREHFATYPWSLSGGGSGDLKSHIESFRGKLGDVVEEIGFGAVTREDDAYMVGPGPLRRSRVPAQRQRPIVEGDMVRDFGIWSPTISVWPYDSEALSACADVATNAFMWPYRVILRIRVAYGQTQLERGLAWFEYSMFFRKRFKAPLIISFAFKASHNHFTLARWGRVFKQTAPVIKLPEGATEDEHLALLSVLNSSTACFWLRESSQHQGGGAAEHPWSWTYEFAGGIVKDFHLPDDLPLDLGRRLDTLAQQLVSVEPSTVCADGVPTRKRLDAVKVEHDLIRGRMIASQEELDWDIYWRYGLLTDDEAAELVAKPEFVPELELGERAFEIVLARRMERGELETQWFARHRSVPITDIPAHWPREYKAIVAKRIEMIERDRNIGLIERPECKRRWQSEPWEAKERDALTNWLLDRCEKRSLWFGPDGNPRPITVNRLADQLRADADVASVARLLAGPDADLADVIADITADEHVPYLAQLRYTGEGLVKRALWEQTWDLQRAEDRTGQRLDIPVPPKYKNTDFRKTSYWRQRGKLDVPKERFISYPGASPDSDDSLLLGWAGWDHREQAYALVALIEERSATDGWECERLRPLLAGLSELMPWVRQWHGERDEHSGTSPAEAFATYLAAQQELCSFTEEDLRNWTPPQPGRSRRARP